MNHIQVTASTSPHHRDITILAVKGSIDTNTAPEFERVFQTALSERKYHLIVDLKEVDYVSSAGWGIFVGEIKRIRAQKGNLFLASMHPEVEEAYQLLELGSIIKAFPNVDLAVQKGFAVPLAQAVAVKAPAARKRGKGRADKSPAEIPASAMESARMAVEPAPLMVPKKDPWLVRLLLPWKWF
jgi:anti-sigma B factor antagonist